MRLRTVLPLALALLAAASCTTVRPTPADPAAARDALLAAHRTGGGGGRVEAGAAEEVVVLMPNHSVARGSAARAALAPTPGARLRWRPVYAEVSRDGTRGYTMGFAELEGARVDSAQRHSAYVAYWRRNTGAPWQILAYLRNPVPPPPATLAPPPVPIPGPGAPGDPAPGSDLVMSADRAFAEMGSKQGPRAAFVEWVADDAVAFGPRGIEYGADVRESFRRGFQGNPQFEWGPTIADLSPSGDMGFTVGEARISAAGANGGPPRVSFSKYLTIWKRQPDGGYKFVVDMGNPRPKT